MPVEFLTYAQAAKFGRYAPPSSSTAEVDRSLPLDDKALGLIAEAAPHTGLGFAVQVNIWPFFQRGTDNRPNDLALWYRTGRSHTIAATGAGSARHF